MGPVNSGKRGHLRLTRPWLILLNLERGSISNLSSLWVRGLAQVPTEGAPDPGKENLGCANRSQMCERFLNPGQCCCNSHRACYTRFTKPQALGAARSLKDFLIQCFSEIVLTKLLYNSMTWTHKTRNQILMVTPFIKYSAYFVINTVTNEIQVKPEPVDTEVSKVPLMWRRTLVYRKEITYYGTKA